MNYTTGNWTVSSDNDSTADLSKNITIPQIDYSKFAITVDEPSECTIVCTAGQRLTPSDQLTFKSQTVNNVYESTSVDPAYRMDAHKGVQIYTGMREIYHAVNSVNGQEVDLPVASWFVLRVPSNALVTEELVKDAMLRQIATLYGSGTDVSVNRIMEIIRGSLNPI